MTKMTETQALAAVASTAAEVREADRRLNEGRTLRDEAIAQALEMGVSQVAIAAAAQLSQAAISRVDRKRVAVSL